MTEYEKPRILSVTAQHVAELERENDKLREQAARLFDKTLELGTENEKLRERIKELEQCIRGDAEGIYRLAKNTGYLHTDVLMESIHNRMRELGVEV